VRSWFGKYTIELKQFATGIAAFAVLAGLVVVYSTAVQDGIPQHPAISAILGVVIVCAKIAVVYLDTSRYVVLITVPLVVTCAAVWILLTAKRYITSSSTLRPLGNP
jgi:hypothetical protein